MESLAEDELLEEANVGLQISIRESGDVAILDLQGKATIGVDNDLLNSHLRKLIANGVRKLLLNLAGPDAGRQFEHRHHRGDVCFPMPPGR